MLSTRSVVDYNIFMCEKINAD